MRFVVATWIVLLLVCDHGALLCDIEGYYWRDYYGTVTDDAIAAGKENNKILYIGQGPVDSIHLLPGKITADSAGMSYFYVSKERHIQKDIKILCTRHLNFFHWIPTNSTMIRHINKHCVIGGYQNKKVLHLGRVTINGEKVPGFLMVHDNTADTGFYTTHKSKAFKFTSNFEILAYDPKITK